MPDCRRKSIEVIKENQAATGAFVASPAFSDYRYSWLRDGSFIAYAMDQVGEHESADRFYQWCHTVILKHEAKARRVIAAVQGGQRDLSLEDFLHTRYTVDGEEVPDKWGNFQLDGYGTWLWGLVEHVRLANRPELLAAFQTSIALTVHYLTICWQLPNYDCWEENPEQVHPSSLAAIYGGLRAIADVLPDQKEQLASICEQIRLYLMQNGTHDGSFVKSIGSTAVDASLLWLAIPFGVVAADDPLMKRTVERIECELLSGYGVHRFAGDVYYGGGQWPLLSAWLGWYYALTDRKKHSEEILDWLKSRCTPEGLPEQVQDHLLAPDKYQHWVERAGLPAHPLLWSHAMYLVLDQQVKKTKM